MNERWTPIATPPPPPPSAAATSTPSAAEASATRGLAVTRRKDGQIGTERRTDKRSLERRGAI